MASFFTSIYYYFTLSLVIILLRSTCLFSKSYLVLLFTKIRLNIFNIQLFLGLFGNYCFYLRVYPCHLLLCLFCFFIHHSFLHHEIYFSVCLGIIFYNLISFAQCSVFPVFIYLYLWTFITHIMTLSHYCHKKAIV